MNNNMNINVITNYFLSKQQSSHKNNTSFFKIWWHSTLLEVVLGTGNGKLTITFNESQSHKAKLISRVGYHLQPTTSLLSQEASFSLGKYSSIVMNYYKQQRINLVFRQSGNVLYTRSTAHGNESRQECKNLIGFFQGKTWFIVLIF